MPMSRDELALMHELWQLSDQIPTFAMRFAGDELPVDEEIAFVHRLADLAESLLCHANGRKGLDLNGQPTPLVIDVDAEPVHATRRALPPAREPDGP